MSDSIIQSSSVEAAPDLNWLRQHSPIFTLMNDKIIEVKKSEAEYKKLLDNKPVLEITCTQC